MQLTPPGTPFPQEMGGADEASSPRANAAEASVVARNPIAVMNALCRILCDSNVVSQVPHRPIGPRTFEFNGYCGAPHSGERENAPDLQAFANRRDVACYVLRCGRKRRCKQRLYESIRRSILRALPVLSSQSITTAHKRASPVAGSKRTGIPFRNLPTTSSFFTPMTPS